MICVFKSIVLLSLAHVLLKLTLAKQVSAHKKKASMVDATWRLAQHMYVDRSNVLINDGNGQVR